MSEEVIRDVCLKVNSQKTKFQETLFAFRPAVNTMTWRTSDSTLTTTPSSKCWAIGLSLLVSIGLGVSANIKQDPYLAVFAVVGAVVVGFVVCLVSTMTSRVPPFAFETLEQEGMIGHGEAR